MKNNDFNQKGGAKKFLYTGPKKDTDDQEDLPWNFGSKNNFSKRTTENSKFELDDVWSIKRNVNVGGGVKEPKIDPLTFSTNKNYYSRYGGNGPSNQTEDKPSNMPSQTHRPFSYSYGADNAQEDHTSPRNVSMSSTGAYTQSTTNSFGTRYPRSQGSDKFSSSNNNALFNNGTSQNGTGLSSQMSNAYPNTGSVTAREGNMMMSSGGRHSMQGRFISTKDSISTNRPRFQGDSTFNQQNKHFW